MAFCEQCGRENRSGARFCTHCGQPINDAALDASLDATLPDQITPLESLSTATDEVAPDLPPMPTVTVETLVEQGVASSEAMLHQELDPDNERRSASGFASGFTTNELQLHNLSAQTAGESKDIPIQNAPLAGEVTIQLETDAEPPYTGKTIPLDKAAPLEALSQEAITDAPLDAPLDASLHNSTAPPIEVVPQPSQEGALRFTPHSIIFEMLPAGSVINGRYRVLSGEWQAETLLYQAEDLHRCWNCQVVQAERDVAFCEACGAELIQKPRLLLRASRQLSEAPRAEESEGDASLPFIENGTLYQVESQPVQVALEPQAVRLMLSVGYRTDAGRQRDNNEDSLLVLHMAAICEMKSSPALGFFAVADGVGGYAAGEVASHAVVRSLTENILGQVFIPEISDQPLNIDDLAERLRLAVLAANQAIIQTRQSSPLGAELGAKRRSTDKNDASLHASLPTQMESTLTAALVRQTYAVIANVGDSRTYLMRQGCLSPLTKDHSVVARLVERGVIQPAEIYTHEQRNLIVRSLGDDGELEVDIYPIELQPGDRLLLCSDGLWEMVHDPFIEDVLLERFDPQQACDKLLELANMAGGEDNISVIVVNLQ